MMSLCMFQPCILCSRSSSDVALHVEDVDDPAPEAGGVSNLPLSRARVHNDRRRRARPWTALHAKI